MNFFRNWTPERYAWFVIAAVMTVLELINSSSNGFTISTIGVVIGLAALGTTLLSVAHFQWLIYTWAFMQLPVYMKTGAENDFIFDLGQGVKLFVGMTIRNTSGV